LKTQRYLAKHFKVAYVIFEEISKVVKLRA